MNHTKNVVIVPVKKYLDMYIHKKKANQRCGSLLPIKLNDPKIEEYAYLIGKITGDGNLDSKYTSRFVGKKEDLITLKNQIVRVFNINPKRLKIREKKAKGRSYVLQVNDAYIGRVLFLLGAPKGNKTKTRFLVPKWINDTKKSRKRFLQALLEDELTTIKIERCNYSVKPKLKMAKKRYMKENLREFLEQIKKMIESFGVTCSNLSGDKYYASSCEIYFHINRNKKNIIKFHEELGFRYNHDKVRQLRSCCKTIRNSLTTPKDL